eukprot:ANDGO_07451.mRNA.1 Putative leucine-rich repeat-containing protein DDB_G0281931
MVVNVSISLQTLDLSGNTITGIPGVIDYRSCQYCILSSVYSLTSLLLEAANLPSQFPPSSVQSSVDICELPPSPLFNILQFLTGLSTLDVSSNDLSDGLDILFSLPLLSLFDIRNNSNARKSLLSYTYGQQFQYDAATNYPYSTTMSCVQATVGRLAFQADPVFFDYENCVCRPGFYGKPPNCTQCLSNADCSFGSEADIPYRNMSVAFRESGNVIARSGYYASPSVTYMQMMNNQAYPKVVEICSHAGTDFSPCDAAEHGPCADGYSGRLCSACAESYFLVGESCFECPNGLLLVAFGVAIFLLISALFVWSLFISSAASGMIKILMLFLQGLFYIHVPMPKFLNFVESTGESTFAISLVGPGCFVSHWSFERSYTLSVLTPWIALFIVFCIWIVGHLVIQFRGFAVATNKKWKDRCRRSAIFFLLFSYMGATKTILTPLACEDDPGDGHSYMVSLPYHKCSSVLTGVSAGLLVVYVVGLPVVLTWIVIRSGVLKKGRQTRRSFVLALLFDSYHPRAYFWELVSTIRRVVFAAAFATFSERSAVRPLLAMTVLGVTLVLQGLFLLFHETSENILEMLEVVILGLNYVIAVKSQVIGTNDADIVGILLFVINIGFVVVSIVVLSSFKFRHLVNRSRKTPFVSSVDVGNRVGENEQELRIGDRELSEALLPSQGTR